jgi:radical SAM superfamily enzyme YgiQ (UPF0313 family)
MNKYVEGLGPDRIENVVRSLADEGIGVHLNLIGGFPGESEGELIESVEFVIRALSGLERATFQLSRFTVFPDTPVFNDPAKFGIRLSRSGGDMPFFYPYQTVSTLRASARRVQNLIPALQGRMYSELGWDPFVKDPGSRAAMDLYFTSGHSLLLKAEAPNGFELPREDRLREMSRWQSAASF